MDDDTAANLFSDHIHNVLVSFIQKLRHEGNVFGFSDFIVEQMIKEKFKNVDDVIEHTDPYTGYHE